MSPDVVEVMARVCYETNRAYCQAIGDNSFQPWDKAEEWQRESNRQGVRFHLENPEAGPPGSHDAWMKAREADGWVYGPFKDPKAKTHPNLRPFIELPVQQQAKDFIFVAIVHSMSEGLARLGLEMLAEESLAEDAKTDE